MHARLVDNSTLTIRGSVSVLCVGTVMHSNTLHFNK